MKTTVSGSFELPGLGSISETVTLNEDIAYFIGCFLGDGHCSGRHQPVLLFTGDSRSEKPMYVLLKEISLQLDPDCTPRIFQRDRNTLCLRVYSTYLFNVLTSVLDLPAGNKTRIADVPHYLRKADVQLKSAVVRGLFDTDGCVFLDERKRYARPYPRLHWVSTSPYLAQFMDEILTELNISHYCYTHQGRQAHVVDAYGHKNLQLWIEAIGFSNPRHLAKI